MKIAYHFPDIPEAQTLNTRMHWGRRAKLAEEAKDYALAKILERRGGRPPAMMKRVAMTVKFTLPTRRKVDWQSLYGRIKAYEDALCPQYDTLNGVRVMTMEGDIVDDNIGVVESLTLEWEYRKGESGVTITLTPLED